MEDARTRVSTLKEEGNGKLKSGDLEQAVALYRQAAEEAAMLPPEELPMPNLRSGGSIAPVSAFPGSQPVQI